MNHSLHIVHKTVTLLEIEILSHTVSFFHMRVHQMDYPRDEILLIEGFRGLQFIQCTRFISGLTNIQKLGAKVNICQGSILNILLNYGLLFSLGFLHYCPWDGWQSDIVKLYITVVSSIDTPRFCLVAVCLQFTS